MNNEQIAYIEQQLFSENHITTQDIANRLHITKPTARKYLNIAVDRNPRFARVHGGAMVLSREEHSEINQEYEYRSTTRKQQKRCIAEKAIRLLNECNTVFLDSGTTCFQFAKGIVDLPYKATVITNGIRTAVLLAQNSDLTVVIASGVTKKGSNTIIDEYDVRSWSHFNIDTYFFSATGISLERGFSEYNMNEIRTKHMLIQHADQSIALLDNSKFDKNSTSSFAAIEEVNLLITDDDADDGIRKRYSSRIEML